MLPMADRACDIDCDFIYLFVYLLGLVSLISGRDTATA